MKRKDIHHKLFVAFSIFMVAVLPFSVILCSWSIVLITLNWIVEGNFLTKWEAVQKNKLIWLFSGFYLLHVMGLILTRDMSSGLFDLEKKLSLFIFPLVLGTSRQLSAREIKSIFNTFILACMAAIFVSLIFAISGPSATDPVHLNFDYLNKDKFIHTFSEVAGTWSLISYAGFGAHIGLHPTYFALYISFAIVLILCLYAKPFAGYRPYKKFVLLVALLLLIVMLVFLSSRIVLAAFFMLCLFSLGYFFIRQRKYFQGALYSLAFASLMAFLVFINPVTHFRVIREPLNTGFSYPRSPGDWNSWSLRMLEWRSALKIIKQNWAMGVGTGDTQTHLNQEYAKIELGIFGTPFNAHNQYLQTLLAVGIIGLLVLMASFTWPAIIAWQENHPIYLAFVFLFAMCCLTESMLQVQKGVVFYGFFNSLLAFHVFQSNDKKYA